MPQQHSKNLKQGNPLTSQEQAVDVGVVVIGRNEGDRLKLCLTSLRQQTDDTIVYVDSGSSDGSVAFAKSVGCTVVELDTSIPFSMARARNTGFETLANLDRQPMYVQFVDGDCELEPGWLVAAMSFLDGNAAAAVACGSLRERFPSASIYNRLANLEWQGPAGSIHACGGNAMYRVEAFETAGRFNERMIAGEEAELCVRMRQAGGEIWRLDLPMAIHDAALTRFGQWWTRARRGGYAYAHGFFLHGASVQKHNRRQLISIMFYGAAMPVIWFAAQVLSLRYANLPMAMLTTILVLLIMLKPAVGAFRHRRNLDNSQADARLYAAFCVLGKFPEALGILKFTMDRLLDKQTRLIEYKTTGS